MDSIRARFFTQFKLLNHFGFNGELRSPLTLRKIKRVLLIDGDVTKFHFSDGYFGDGKYNLDEVRFLIVVERERGKKSYFGYNQPNYVVSGQPYQELNKVQQESILSILEA
jgi:hypothetical protein